MGNNSFYKLTCLFFFFSSLLPLVLSAQAVVIKDIRTGKPDACRDTFNILTVGTKVFFTANNGVNGNELWVTDGTTANTQLVKDIKAGSLSSHPLYFMAFNNLLYFFADDGINGIELWRSDGTAAGTAMVKNIRAGTASSMYLNIAKFPSIIFNNQLFFMADDGVNGMELWKTDGTTTGTVLVKNMGTDFIPSFPEQFLIFNNKLYITTAYEELWVSDGTTAGTTLVKKFNSLGNMVIFKNEIYLVADDGAGKGYEIWRTNGTTFTLVKDINTRAGHGGLDVTLNTSESRLMVYGNFIYFPCDDGIRGPELWRTDGTEAGTVLFKEFTTGIGGYPPQNFRILNNILYFKAANEANSNEYLLYRCDGTLAGTRSIKGGVGGSPLKFSLPTLFHIHNQKIYLNPTPFFGKELWETDGTDAGTKKLASSSVEFGLQPSDFVSLGTKLIFRGEDAALGWELMTLPTRTDAQELTNLSKKMSVSPNPVSQNLTIQLKDATINALEKNFSLFNAQGQLVKSGQFSGDQTTLNCADLPNGFYLIHIQTAIEQASQKVIVKH
jgi:trimeric autotransporter adhesin